MTGGTGNYKLTFGEGVKLLVETREYQELIYSKDNIQIEAFLESSIV